MCQGVVWRAVVDGCCSPVVNWPYHGWDTRIGLACSFQCPLFVLWLVHHLWGHPICLWLEHSVRDPSSTSASSDSSFCISLFSPMTITSLDLSFSSASYNFSLLGGGRKLWVTRWASISVWSHTLGKQTSYSLLPPKKCLFPLALIQSIFHCYSPWLH